MVIFLLNNYTVYIHVNKTNNKKYVGITSKKPLTRWNNGNGYKTNNHFYSAIQKYGWDGFEHIIYKDHIIKLLACELLKQLIKEYNSQNPDYGYNILEGGQITHHSEYVKKKISESHMGLKNANYGRKWSLEIKNKIRQSISGLNSPCYGKHPSQLTRDKMSVNHANVNGGNNPAAKKVLCILTNQIFSCAQLAADYIHRSIASLTACCRGLQKICANLHWKYIDDVA